MGITASNISRSVAQSLPRANRSENSKIPSYALRAISGSISLQLERIVPFSTVAMLAFAMIILQVLDGSLTFMGVELFGFSAEGNPLVRTLMHSMGALPALAIVKGIAILAVALLAYLAAHVSWIPTALRALVLIYTCGAVLPWTAILISNWIA